MSVINERRQNYEKKLNIEKHTLNCLTNALTSLLTTHEDNTNTFNEQDSEYQSLLKPHSEVTYAQLIKNNREIIRQITRFDVSDYRESYQQKIFDFYQESKNEDVHLNERLQKIQNNRRTIEQKYRGFKQNFDRDCINVRESVHQYEALIEQSKKDIETYTLQIKLFSGTRKQRFLRHGLLETIIKLKCCDFADGITLPISKIQHAEFPLISTIGRCGHTQLIKYVRNLTTDDAHPILRSNATFGFIDTFFEICKRMNINGFQEIYCSNAITNNKMDMLRFILQNKEVLQGLHNQSDYITHHGYDIIKWMHVVRPVNCISCVTLCNIAIENDRPMVFRILHNFNYHIDIDQLRAMLRITNKGTFIHWVYQHYKEAFDMSTVISIIINAIHRQNTSIIRQRQSLYGRPFDSTIVHQILDISIQNGHDRIIRWIFLNYLKFLTRSDCLRLTTNGSDTIKMWLAINNYSRKIELNNKH
jgi:hypothetical protein